MTWWELLASWLADPRTWGQIGFTVIALLLIYAAEKGLDPFNLEGE
jgi:hypothetical protein